MTSDLAVQPAPVESEWAVFNDEGVDFLLDLRLEAKDASALAENRGLGYRKLGFPEFEAPAPELLNEAALWVHRHISAGERVVVFCREGRGRSAMVCCAALVLKGVQLQTAYRLVYRAQPLTTLSDAQTAALEQFARSTSHDAD